MQSGRSKPRRIGKTGEPKLSRYGNLPQKSRFACSSGAQARSGRPHDEYTRRAALEVLLTSIDEEDTEIYNRTRDQFEDPDDWP